MGLYLGVEASQLRYFTAEGQKVPTPEEAAQQEQRRAEQAELQLEQERQEKQRLQAITEQLAEQLRSLGVDPETLA